MTEVKPRERKCLTCRFYEPSPLWRKGWCRNPLLFDAQTNHLVEAESLSCSRTFIDYWEARDPTKNLAGSAADSPRQVRRAPSIPMTPTGPGGAPLRGNVATVAAVQAANQPRERPPQLALVKPAPDVTPLESIAAPVTAPVPPPAPVAADLPGPLVAPHPVVRPTGEFADDSGRVRILGGGVLVALLAAGAIFLRGDHKPAPLPTLAPLTPVSSILNPTATPRPPASTPAPSVVPTLAPLILAPGAFAQSTGLGGSSLNIRQVPGLRGRLLGQLPASARAQIHAGPQTVDGIVWWQISGWDAKGTLGWASGKFLKPVR
ncbi:MAG TPA: SH3 domain-containing protein [Chloroflexia bacterium]|nr:SH3 domain-containing protein [Chloroflexia bacterium]